MNWYLLVIIGLLEYYVLPILRMQKFYIQGITGQWILTSTCDYRYEFAMIKLIYDTRRSL